MASSWQCRSSSNSNGGRRWWHTLLAGFGIASLVCYAYVFWPSVQPCWRFSNNSWPATLPLLPVSASVARTPVEAPLPSPPAATSLDHIVFAIAAASSKLRVRQDYIRVWWRSHMRGFIWLDRPPNPADLNSTSSSSPLPPWRVSEPTNHFNYTWEGGSPSAIRVARIVSETFRLNLTDVRWFVMGDDDTVFFPDNLAHLLSQYDHTLPYYIGYHSESHVQNVFHSYDMAFGGGGFAISYPLAKALAKTQDACINRYHYMYGSDGRIAACVLELGTSLTKHAGFHQVDLRGSLFGILAAHPLAPLVSLHHFDSIDPIFPSKSIIESLKHLMKAVNVNPHGILQQSICYDKANNWSISVSNGFAVQIYQGILPMVELQKPLVTFSDWQSRSRDSFGFTFNTRPWPKDNCAWNIFYMDTVKRTSDNSSVTTFLKFDMKCNKPTSFMDVIQVYQEIESLPQLQLRSLPQVPLMRQCCEVIHPLNSSSKIQKMEIKVRRCREGEEISVG